MNANATMITGNNGHSEAFTDALLLYADVFKILVAIMIKLRLVTTTATISNK